MRTVKVTDRLGDSERLFTREEDFTEVEYRILQRTISDLVDECAVEDDEIVVLTKLDELLG